MTMGWQPQSEMDNFLNDLDRKECQLLIFMLAELRPYEFVGGIPRYATEEQALIGRMKDAQQRLQDAGELPESKYKL
jgi:hypothetical protein